MNGLPAELAVLQLGRLEEGEGSTLLILAEHVQRERLFVLDDLVGAGIGLDPDDDQRRRESGLSDPIDGGRRDIAFSVIGGQHVNPVGDHAQRGFLGILVHIRPPR